MYKFSFYVDGAVAEEVFGSQQVKKDFLPGWDGSSEPDTRKGVPVTHMVIGRTEAQDIAYFLDFVRKEEPDFYPELLVIDKSDMEAKGAKMFAKEHNLNIKIFICFFHSAQAIFLRRWLTTSKNRFPQEDVDDLMKMIRMLHHAKSAKEYLELKDLFLRWISKNEWFTCFWAERWQRCYVPRIHDFVFFTNNYIESWQRILKTLALRNKKNRRLESLHKFHPRQGNVGRHLYNIINQGFFKQERIPRTVQRKQRTEPTRLVHIQIGRPRKNIQAEMQATAALNGVEYLKRLLENYEVNSSSSSPSPPPPPPSPPLPSPPAALSSSFSSSPSPSSSSFSSSSSSSFFFFFFSKKKKKKKQITSNSCSTFCVVIYSSFSHSSCISPTAIDAVLCFSFQRRYAEVPVLPCKRRRTLAILSTWSNYVLHCKRSTLTKLYQTITRNLSIRATTRRGNDSSFITN
eukprot:g76205.t1